MLECPGLTSYDELTSRLETTMRNLLTLASSD